MIAVRFEMPYFGSRTLTTISDCIDWYVSAFGRCDILSRLGKLKLSCGKKKVSCLLVGIVMGKFET